MRFGCFSYLSTSSNFSKRLCRKPPPPLPSKPPLNPQRLLFKLVHQNKGSFKGPSSNGRAKEKPPWVEAPLNVQDTTSWTYKTHPTMPYPQKILSIYQAWNQH